jgi:hypothetical protein
VPTGTGRGVLSLPFLIDGLVPRLALAVDGDPSTAVPAEGAEVEPVGDGAAGFPRTVAHRLGEAVIETQPARIVATADRDQLDVLLAMGVAPVLVGESGDYAEPPPWIDPDLLDGVETAPMADAFTPNLELIAGARPDLIVDAWSGDETQASLEQLAPTIQIKVANETTWQEAQRVAGAATGLEAEADAAIAETKRRSPPPPSRSPSTTTSSSPWPSRSTGRWSSCPATRSADGSSASSASRCSTRPKGCPVSSAWRRSTHCSVTPT